MTVVHGTKAQLPRPPQVGGQDLPSTAENIKLINLINSLIQTSKSGISPFSSFLNLIFVACSDYMLGPEVVGQSVLAGVKDHVVPHILTTERSQHGEENIEQPEGSR